MVQHSGVRGRGRETERAPNHVTEGVPRQPLARRRKPQQRYAETAARGTRAVHRRCGPRPPPPPRGREDGRERTRGDATIPSPRRKKVAPRQRRRETRDSTHRVEGGKTGSDPSAGSPTETLLRLLLPLNDKVWAASQGVAGGEPSASPQSKDLTGSFNR